MKTTIALALAASTAIATSAAADGHAVTEFRIGLLGGENAQDRLNNNECLRAYTEELLGVPTRLFAPADYNGVIQGLLGGSLDMAWLGASSYAAIYLEDAEAVEPVLVKTNLDGSFSYHSIGFARVDSGITSLEDMKGKVFGFGTLMIRKVLPAALGEGAKADVRYSDAGTVAEVLIPSACIAA